MGAAAYVFVTDGTALTLQAAVGQLSTTSPLGNATFTGKDQAGRITYFYTLNATGGVAQTKYDFSGASANTVFTFETVLNTTDKNKNTVTLYADGIAVAKGDNWKAAMATPETQADNTTKLAALSGAVNGSIAKALPEPAPATLSLLALAGLAARRRRK